MQTIPLRNYIITSRNNQLIIEFLKNLICAFLVICRLIMQIDTSSKKRQVFYKGILMSVQVVIVLRYNNYIFSAILIFSGDRFAFSCHDERYHPPSKEHSTPLVDQWRIKTAYAFSVKSKLLLPPDFLYRCLVSMRPAFLKSSNARLTVDWDSLRSLAIVGMAGQHCASLPARSDR